MELKIVCGCGQKYTFDVEPVHGQMPVRVNCPVCGADGTAAANDILYQRFSHPAPSVSEAPAVQAVAASASAIMPAAASAAALRLNRPVPEPAAVAAPPPLPATPRPIAPLKPLSAKPGLTWYEYIWIGLPLLLIAIGGAVGGACGGAACAINRAVFLKVSNPVLKYVWTGLISAAAFVVWLVIAAMLFGFLQGLHGR